MKKDKQEALEKKISSTYKAVRDARVGFFSSMRFKMLLFVLVSVVLVGGVILLVAIPESSSQMTRITQNYMYDITKAAADQVDILIDAKGSTTAKSLLPELASDIAVEDVPSSYCYIVDNNGTMVYHPTAEKIGQPVENAVITGVVSKLKNGENVETAVVGYEFNGVTKYAGYCVNKTEDYIIVVTADESDILSPISDIISKIAICSVVALLVCAVAVFVLLTIMLRPLGNMSQAVNKFAYLDFTKDENTEKYSKRKDEIGVMGRATEGLRRQLVQIVQDLQEQSRVLHETSENMQNKAMETADVINQVDNAVHDIADGASSQASETQNATDNVLLIGDMIQDNNGNIQAIKTSSDQIKTSANLAGDNLKQLTGINAKVKEAIDEIYHQTNTTNESALKIKEAAALITSIAEETNLLSLNASIEAARAGEHGRGFAVVANQIQKLAEQSNESAIRIEGIISELISDSERSVATMEEVRQVVGQQDESVKKTDEIFKTVQTGIEGTLSGIEEMADKTGKMESAREGVVDTVQNLTAIAEENAASTQETSASVTTVRNSVDLMSDSANGLNDIASKLEETMKKFTI